MGVAFGEVEGDGAVDEELEGVGELVEGVVVVHEEVAEGEEVEGGATQEGDEAVFFGVGLLVDGDDGGVVAVLHGVIIFLMIIRNYHMKLLLCG